MNPQASAVMAIAAGLGLETAGGSAPGPGKASPSGGRPADPLAGARRCLRLPMSPHYGTPDFSVLARHAMGGANLDLVSVADLLRNGFVYPPHSIFDDVNLVTPGFDLSAPAGATPAFSFEFRDSGRCQDDAEGGEDWVETYHGLLCNALASACRDMRAPWLLQSGGKDSTPLAIAAAEVRPETTCITYLGGSEENEVASARFVARSLGLRHETLVCDAGRAYDRYLAVVDRIPLLTADFALLSYVDLATTILDGGGDGVIDGMGADSYFGWPMHSRQRLLSWLAKGMRLPGALTELPLVRSRFELCYLLSTLQMDPVERVFPGSRFTDVEVDALFGRSIAGDSRARLAPFLADLGSASSPDEWQAMAGSIAAPSGSFGKGLYTTGALGLRPAYPFCDRALREWVYRKVPRNQLVDPVTRANKVLVRKHIARRFEDLPYVARKGSFRFDLCGLAAARFDDVRAHAAMARAMLPGAETWLDRNRDLLGNKYHASKFYLLAIVLPWIVHHANLSQTTPRAPPTRARKQITMSPYYGKPDFSALSGDDGSPERIDAVSVADLLRNAFVQPPHSIFEDVKLATLGFDPLRDVTKTTRFRFKFPDSGKRRATDAGSQDWVGTYHRLLCEAVTTSCAGIGSPWLLQSGGKDSTSLAIATVEARPETTCITYLGGREENEVASASAVARTLGLRHEVLTCDPGRAYDRYLSIVHRMPLLTADFAMLSYVDLATEVRAGSGDGVIDGLGSDSYFGMPVNRQQRILSRLALGIGLPGFLTELPLVDRSFSLCFGLSTLQMDPLERIFPGTRFTDREVDSLFGRPISHLSRKRLAPFKAEIASATSFDEVRTMAITVAESASAYAKGLYTTSALSLRSAYPYCDRRLREWVYREVPMDQLIDPVSRASKVLVRNHIATRFGELPYVSRKGSFRFDLCGLAKQRFEQVLDSAVAVRDALPGAAPWLERNRRRLDNKYHASKFYLLAVVVPWIAHHGMEEATHGAASQRARRMAP